MKTLRKNNKKSNPQKYQLTKRKKGGSTSMSARSRSEEKIPILEISEIINLLFEIYDDNEHRHYLSDFLTEFEKEYRSQINNVKCLFGIVVGEVDYHKLVKLIDIILNHIKNFLEEEPDIAKIYIHAICNILITILENELYKIPKSKFLKDQYPPLNKQNIFLTILHALFIEYQVCQNMFLKKLINILFTIISSINDDVVIRNIYLNLINPKVLEKINPKRLHIICYLKHIDMIIELLKNENFHALLKNIIIGEKTFDIVIGTIGTFATDGCTVPLLLSNLNDIASETATTILGKITSTIGSVFRGTSKKSPKLERMSSIELSEEVINSNPLPQSLKEVKMRENANTAAINYFKKIENIEMTCRTKCITPTRKAPCIPNPNTKI
jgi:hypothetical protein